MKRKTILIISVLLAIIALALVAISSGHADRVRNEKLLEQKTQQQQEIRNLEKSIDQIKSESDKLKQDKTDLEKKSQDQQNQINDLNNQLSIKKANIARLAALQAAGGNCESYRPLFAKYDWNVNTAMAIMQAESGCRPTAVSPTDDHGLMQINHGVEIYGQQIYDPAFNIAIAYSEKYEKGGWRHWSVYNSGAYLRYLAA